MARKQSGQALVEAALTVPLLAVLLLAIATVGYLFNSQLVVTNACREGARMGAVGQTTGTIQKTVGSYLESGGLKAGQATIKVQGAGADSGALLSVRVDYAMPLPVTVAGLPSTLTLRARSTMRIE